MRIVLSIIATLTFSCVSPTEARADSKARLPSELEVVGSWFGYDNGGSGYFFYLDLKADTQNQPSGGICVGLLNGKFSGIYLIDQWRFRGYELLLTNHEITKASAPVDLTTTHAFYRDIGLSVKSIRDNKVRKLTLRRPGEMLKLRSRVMTYLENSTNAPVSKPPRRADRVRTAGAWLGLDTTGLSFYRLVLDQNGIGTMVSRTVGADEDVSGAYMIDEWSTREKELKLKFHPMDERSPKIEVKAGFANDNTVSLRVKFAKYQDAIPDTAALHSESDLLRNLSECKKLIERATPR